MSAAFFYQKRSELIMSERNILFLFREGRRKRLNSGQNFPKDFFYGFHGLPSLGWDANFLEEADLFKIGGYSFTRKIANLMGVFLGNFPVFTMLQLCKRSPRTIINTQSIVVATTNTLGLSLSAARTLGVIKPNVFFLAMGLVPTETSKWAVEIIKFVTKKSLIVAISESEKAHLEAVLKRRIEYLPFGVDVGFWNHREPVVPGSDYILAIGNDKSRDWTTLVDSWLPHFPSLKIITKQKVIHNAHNIEVIDGSWQASKISDTEIRALYAQALFVIVPVINTIQPAGQSCCLQAMSCGKAVIMSDIDGFWDRKAFIHKENIILVPPQSRKHLIAAVESMIKNPARRREIGLKSRVTVQKSFNTVTMASRMSELMENFYEQK